MQHPDEGTIHAWLDGALDAEEGARLERHVESCAECSAAVAEARGLIAASSRIVSHLDSVPANVIPAKPARQRSIWLRSAWPSAIAATLIIGIGLFSSREKEKPMAGLDRIRPEVPNLDSFKLAEPERTAQTANAEVRPPRTIGPDRVAPPAAAVGAVSGDQAAAAIPQPAETRIARIPPPAPRSMPITQKSASVSNAPVLSEVVVTGTADSARRERVSAVGGTARSAPLRRDLPRAAAGAAAAPEMARQRGFSDAVATFSGCYELDASTDVLPARFALMPDSAPAMPGHYAVRYIDAGGRTSEPIADAGWTSEAGRAIVKTISRGTILTISRDGAQVTAQSPNGTRAGSVAICR
jgi:hypothetical protein